MPGVIETPSRKSILQDNFYSMRKESEEKDTFSNISDDLCTFPIREIMDLFWRRLTTAIFSSSSTTWSSSCMEQANELGMIKDGRYWHENATTGRQYYKQPPYKPWESASEEFVPISGVAVDQGIIHLPAELTLYSRVSTDPMSRKYWLRL